MNGHGVRFKEKLTPYIRGQPGGVLSNIRNNNLKPIIMLLICLLILVAIMKGKDFKPLMEKLKNIDWKRRCQEAWEEIKNFGNTVKREACEKCLQAWYVLNNPDTPKLDKILIYAAIFYTMSSKNFIPFAEFGFLGLLDECAAINFVINRIDKNITPAIKLKAKEKVEEWFGPEYTVRETGE